DIAVRGQCVRVAHHMARQVDFPQAVVGRNVEASIWTDGDPARQRAFRRTIEFLNLSARRDSADPAGIGFREPEVVVRPGYDAFDECVAAKHAKLRDFAFGGDTRDAVLTRV